MAGKRIAAWRDEHQLASPPTHAGLGKLRVVVRDDKFDADFAFQSFLFAFQKFDGMIQLLARRQQIFAIGKGPAVILDVGEFDARRARGFREGQHFLELIDVAAVDDEVEGNGDAMVPEPIKNAEFLRVGLCAGNIVGGFFTRALEA